MYVVDRIGDWERLGYYVLQGFFLLFAKSSTIFRFRLIANFHATIRKDVETNTHAIDLRMECSLAVLITS